MTKDRIKRWFTAQNVAVIFVPLSIVITVFGSAAQHNKFDLGFLLLDIWNNLAMTLLSIAATVLIIDKLNERRATDDELKRLTLQMGSPDRGFAIEAVRILRDRGWLTNGALAGQSFESADFQEGDLTKANLRGARLSYVNLQGTDLTYADLSGADLGGTKCQQPDNKKDTRAATFWHANLHGATLGSSNLTGVNFGGTDLRGADLTGATLWHVTITDDTKFDENTILPNGAKYTKRQDIDEFTSPRIQVMPNPFYG